MPQPFRVTQHQQKSQTKGKKDSRGLYPGKKDLFPVSGMALDRNRIGSDKHLT
jgi:hypothetical protein